MRGSCRISDVIESIPHHCSTAKVGVVPLWQITAERITPALEVKASIRCRGSKEEKIDGLSPAHKVQFSNKRTSLSK